MITKSTIIGISASGFVTLIASMWLVIGEVQSWVGKIEDNTGAIAALSTDVKMARLYDMIGDLRRERRGLRRALEDRPGDDIIEDQIDDITDEIERLENILECVMEGGENCVGNG